MSNTNNNIMSENALTDVRRAYRLIYDYQDRLYGIIRDIQGSMNLNFYKWETSYENLGNTTIDFASRDVWNGIPLHDFYLVLLPQSQNADNPSENDWMLSLHFLADRDAYDEETELCFTDKEARPEKFVVEQSKSVLRIGIYLMDSDCKIKWTDKWEEDCDYEKEINLASLEDECSLNKMLDDFKQEAIKELDLDKGFFANKE